MTLWHPPRPPVMIVMIVMTVIIWLVGCPQPRAQPPYPPGTAALVLGETFHLDSRVLGQRPGGLARRAGLHYLPLPEERHSTIYPVAALRAFRTLFAAKPPKA